MVDHIKPTIREYQPDHVIIHAATNDLPNDDKTPIQICNDLINLAASIKTQDIEVAISAIVPRGDSYNEKAMLVNDYLQNIIENTGYKFIRHDNIKPENHLNGSKLHLNQKGNSIFTSNFRRYLLNNN